MKRFLLFIFLISPIFLFAGPRNPLPKTPDQVWQNDQDLTDATNRVSTRLNNMGVVNIKDFGAKCDGVTNDMVAIQSAIDSLTSGGTILVDGMCGISGTNTGAGFSNGVYLTQSSVTFVGNNNQTSGFIWVSTIPGNMFRSVGTNVDDGMYTYGIRFTNLKLQGISSLHHVESVPFWIHKFNDFTIDNCVIKGFSGVGGAYVGLSSTELSRRFTFVHNYVDGDGVVPQTAVTMYNVDGFDISHNTFISTSETVKLETQNVPTGAVLNNGVVSHNIVRNGNVCTYSNSNSFMAFGSQATIGNEVAYVVFDGNEIYDSSSTTGTNASGAFIFYGSTGTNQGNVHHITISNNIFNRFTPNAGLGTDFGVLLQNVDHFTVIGNSFSNPLTAVGSFGILLSDARYSLIADNKIDGTNWSQSLEEDATIECRNEIHGNLTTNDSGSLFSNFATSKSNITQSSLFDNRTRSYRDGYYFGRLESGNTYDAAGNQYRAVMDDINIITTIASSTGTIGFTSSWVMYVSTGSTKQQQWVKIGSQ